MTRTSLPLINPHCRPSAPTAPAFPDQQITRQLSNASLLIAPFVGSFAGWAPVASADQNQLYPASGRRPRDRNLCQGGRFCLCWRAAGTARWPGHCRGAEGYRSGTGGEEEVSSTLTKIRCLDAKVDNGWVQQNLRRKALARAVDASRLIFAPHLLSYPDNLARLRVLLCSWTRGPTMLPRRPAMRCRLAFLF